MTKETAIALLNNLRAFAEDDDEPAIDMAIEALQTAEINCVNCPHYYETEDDTGVHGHCEPKFYDEDDYWNGRVPTNGRLIDADALSKKLCETTIFIKDGGVFQRMINDAPTVQADRPHGEWIKTADGNGWNEWGVFKCPLCGATIEDKQYRSWWYNFCPNCGADMRKEKECL